MRFRHALRWLSAAVLLAATLASQPLVAQSLASFEQRVTVHRLANGWTFLLVRRPVAPVFSFVTIADVGSAQEVPGIFGLAHMFEHMAFKGTPNIGTTDWPAEEKALARVETAYQAWQAERLSARPDAAKLEALLAEFKRREEEAGRFVIKGEFDSWIQREGGVGLNASTGADTTRYFYSLPANKLELFAYLESERFFHPVFREFYQERDVVQDERRYSVDSQPVGKLLEQLLGSSFINHPYGHSTIGAVSDLQSFTRTDAEAFFRTWYAPSNLLTVLVGDVDPATAIPMIEKYFGRIPSRPAPPPLRTVEPEQIAEKTIVLKDRSEPLYIEAYHKPAITNPDEPAWDVLDLVLSSGRASRLYRSLVRDKKLAVSVSTFSGIPGAKYPHLWGVFVVPAQGAALDKVRDAVRVELDRLKSGDLADAELARAKRRVRATLVRDLQSNEGLARQLADYQRFFGDWRETFRYLDRVDAVTKADVQRIATAAFVDSHRTVGEVIRDEQPAPGPTTAQEGN
ncbi:MAG TPA: pitrilysin family protein [Thermoanaerobaculia bacterium]|nr:pitrilysin family protein [Thermoanaerobaculia bacterium]